MSHWRNTHTHYSIPAKVAHWVTAVTFFGLFGLGWWMMGLGYYDTWYQRGPFWHVGVGVLLMLWVALRLGYRLSSRYPPPLVSHRPWEVKLSHLVHGLLYMGLFGLGITGYLIVTAKGQALTVFDWFSLPPVFEGNTLATTAGRLHWALAWGMVGLVTLHVSAALKHHFVDKDATLLRMISASSRARQTNE